jgi:hypothetical protein
VTAMSQAKLFDRYGLPARHAEPSTEPSATAHRRSAPIAANADPVSSHVAGDAIQASGVDANQMRAIVDWMRASAIEPLTSFEIAKYAGFDRYHVGRRMATLEQQGKVERCAKRICRVSRWSIDRGIPCETWQLIDGAVAPKQQRHEQPLGLAAAGSTLAPEPGAEPATCPRCKGAGVRRISTEPAIRAFCDETSGKACMAAERRRCINGDPNYELSPSELEALAR